MKGAAAGVIISIICIYILGARDFGGIFAELFFYETIPGYNIMNNEPIMLFDGGYSESIEVVGKNDVEIKTKEAINGAIQDAVVLKDYSNFDELRKNFYVIDKRTGMTQDLFNVKNFMSCDLKLKGDDNKPKILIFHTHSREMFADSDTSDINEGIVGAGEYLKELLENKYGIKCIHHTGSYDVVDGKSYIRGAYERMEPGVRKVINENPSLELAIDLHRDGIAEDKKLVTTINGKPTAKIMFFNGLCKLNENGKLNDIANLSNEYLSTNLALSFQMELTARKLYPGFTRKIYLNAYRYSLHMLPKSLLIEAGAQTNTKEEIYNAMELLAEILNEVVG